VRCRPQQRVDMPLLVPLELPHSLELVELCLYNVSFRLSKSQNGQHTLGLLLILLLGRRLFLASMSHSTAHHNSHYHIHPRIAAHISSHELHQGSLVFVISEKQDNSPTRLNPPSFRSLRFVLSNIYLNRRCYVRRRREGVYWEKRISFV